MRITLTAKLKLLTTPDQFKALRATRLAYRAALNHFSAYSFAHSKTSSRKRLQKATYPDLRSQFGLPAETGLQCAPPGGSHLSGAVDQSEEERRSPAPHATPNAASRAWTKHQTHVSPTPTYNLGRDYSLRADQQVSLLALAGRVHVSYPGYRRHVALLQEGATIGGAKLWYDRGKQRFNLLVSLTIDTLDPTPEGTPQVLGVDVGQRSPLHRGHAGQWRTALLGKGDPQQDGPLRPLAETTGAEKALAVPHGAESPLARQTRR